MKKILLILTLGLMFGQTELTTRVFEYDINNDEFLDLNDLTGHDLDNAIFQFYSLSDYELNGNVEYWYTCDSHWGYHEFFTITGNGIGNAVKTHTYTNDDNCRFQRTSGNQYSDGILKLAITAEFPIEDTGYIEEGYEFCVNSGANLMSFPCDNAVAVVDAIPTDGLGNLTSIIGEGSATTNVGGNWVGGLQDLEPTKGYWIMANSSFCFDYDCSEN